jgi:ribosome-associated protein
MEKAIKFPQVLTDLFLSEIVFKAVRSRGPGGQNVNKVSSAAMAFWNVQTSALFSVEQKDRIIQKLQNSLNHSGEIYVRSDEFRDLERNKQRCLEKLKQMIAQALHKPKQRRPTRPTKASKLRKQVSKIHRSETKAQRKKLKF